MSFKNIEVNKGSINLMQSIKEEIAFGEAILNLVKQINSNESVIKRQKNSNKGLYRI